MGNQAANKALNYSKRRFAEEYVVDGNATAAAKRAGYSEKTAYTIGARLLKDPRVQDRIDELQRAISEKSGLTAVMLDQALLNIIKLDPGKLFDENGDLILIKDLDDETRLALAGLDIVETWVGGDQDKSLLRTKKFKLHDKVSAIALAYKRKGLLIEKQEVDHKNAPPTTPTVVILPSNGRDSV